MTNEYRKAAIDLCERFWERILEEEPIVGTFFGDERYDDRLPDPSEAGLERRRELCEGALAGLDTLDRASLDVDLRTTLDVLEAASRRMLEDIRVRIDRLYVVSHFFGPGNLLAELGSLQRADTPERLEKYLGRLSAFPAYMRALGEVADGGPRQGQTAPALVVDRSIAQVERLLALDPAASPGVNPVPEDRPEHRARVVEVLRDAVWPALRDYLESLRRYRPSARDTVGLSALSNGEDLYASQIFAYTTLPLQARKVHDLGVETLAGIQEERRQIAEALGHRTPADALAEYDATGKNRARTREEMLRLVEDQVARSWEAAPRFFARLPTANCRVRAVEEFREADMAGAFYTPPTADGSRPGIYYVNCGDLDDRPLHQTATTTYHEANPGHHFQLSIEQEFTERLRLRRFGGFLIGDSFVEGWGLYSERLADEMGLFLGEYERLGMLEAQAFRAGRLIVDTGLHALGWDRERAVRQMMETGATRTDSEIEVDRYIATPGQALAYMVGKLEIDRWREAAAKRGGAQFSLKDFHDHVLRLGSLPLAALERELAGGNDEG